MSGYKRMILVSFAILIVLTVAACGAATPTATPTPKNTPLPSVTPTLENTPLPPTPAPTMEGLLDVGGFSKLAYQCFGEGTPTVIVEAALGDQPLTSMTWKAITDKVQNITRICIYNRALIHTSADDAKNLYNLLHQIPLPGPYILVAHSLGGYHARVFAHLYPQDVAGLVLVDTTIPDAETKKALLAAFPTSSPNEASLLTETRAALETPVKNNSDDWQGLDFEASSEQVHQAGSLGDIPLIVISHTSDLQMYLAQGFAMEDAKRLDGVWQTLQSDLAKSSSKGVFMTAKNSDHYIPMHEPQIIIDAIIQMVEELRKQ